MIKLSRNALTVLKKRYLKGVETPERMFRRVAHHVAQAELKYGPKADVERIEGDFYQLMSKLEFLPNSPTIMNAGTRLGQLSACFVLPVEDSIESIFQAVKNMALIHQSGGGTGFSFSELRPRGDLVKTTKGVSSGPVSFMRVYDSATETIKQGGARRGANMAILRVDHPDILEFINCKRDPQAFNNFNISVGLTNDFMNALKANRSFNLINPRTKKIVSRCKAKEIFDGIIKAANENGEPGVVFLDRINQFNPTPKLGKIQSTNPCGEQPLLPYESCNLGSINLAKMIILRNKKPFIDYHRLAKTVRLAVRFLDNVIDVNRYPFKEIEKATKGNRKIGLGVMGFADLLIQLGIPYDSKEALRIAEELMRFISQEAKKTSSELARSRGVFPNWKRGIHKKRNLRLRNATTTTIAPTGTISIIADCSSGIEPLFAIYFEQFVLEGERLKRVNPYFIKMAKREGFYTKDLLKRVSKVGTIQEMKEIPKKVRRLFVTARDISSEWHIRMQAAFQKHVDNAVSKTINFGEKATEEDVRKAFLLAYRLGCKGVTVYRYGSRERQALRVCGYPECR